MGERERRVRRQQDDNDDENEDDEGGWTFGTDICDCDWCNLLGVNNPGENDGQVPPCSDFQPGTTYWITDDHEYLCSPDTCGGDGVFGVPGKGAFVIHGGSFQRWLLPAPQDNATSDSACGLTNDAPGPDVLGFQV